MIRFLIKGFFHLLVTIPLILNCRAALGISHGNPDAPRGGRLVRHLSSDPAHLNPITSSDYYEGLVTEYIYETLAERDVETYEFIPLLAESWEISEDKTAFTFHLNKNAKWQDGMPVTSADVKYSYDIFFDDNVNAAHQRAYYMNIESCEAVDEHTVRFKVKNKYYLNFEMAAGLIVVPRHLFSRGDVNTSPLNLRPVGTGPYRVADWIKGSKIMLERVDDYWGEGLPQNAGRYNFDQIVFKMVRDERVAFEMFKKGDIDLYSFYPRQWIKETNGEAFKSGKVKKLDVQNKLPNGYSYIGWNNQHPLFRDKRVRRAMTHLIDRELFNEKFYYGLYAIADGPFGKLSDYSSPNVQPLEFSISKAIELLKQAGWDDHDKDTVLDKDDRRFEFTLIAPGRDYENMLTIIQEDMRQAGILMNIKIVEWNSFLKLLDDQRFAAVTLSWSSAVDPDPSAIWHSKNSRKGGDNFISYKNERVDELCEKGIFTYDSEERKKYFRQIHEILHEDQPYTFLLEPIHQLVGYNSKLKMVKPYYNYGVGYAWWWVEKSQPDNE